MEDALQIVMVTISTVTVSWHPYKPPTSGAGTRSPRVSVLSYDIEMATNDENWTVVGNVWATATSDRDAYRYRVERLTQGERYRFRLVIVWMNGNKPIRSIPGPSTRKIPVHCGQFAP